MTNDKLQTKLYQRMSADAVIQAEKERLRREER